MNARTKSRDDPASGIAAQLKARGRELGFDRIGIASIELGEDERRLERWLALGRHGEMAYMARHGQKRSRPEELIEGTVSVVCARMNYLPEGVEDAEACLADGHRAYIARYALGRDYHKLLRNRLRRLAEFMRSQIVSSNHRVFVDSAPVLEKALARNAGLGWIGKHTNLLDRDASSWFLLGEIYTDMALPPDREMADHCGSCTACIDACPTGAIVAPYELDARRCISYLTIELRGPIPVDLRPDVGNRIFGCDDCQLVCPWNKFARRCNEQDFLPRHGLDSATLIDLFSWERSTWERKTEGSALRRAGYEGWLRNIAVALGNGPPSDAAREALLCRRDDPSALVREHVEWALQQLGD